MSKVQLLDILVPVVFLLLLQHFLIFYNQLYDSVLENLKNFLSFSAFKLIKIKNSIRNMVQFRVNDIIKERSFVFCDIILCRNMLICFNKQLQEETLLKFHECLNHRGYLVLGVTETLVGKAVQMYETITNRLRIYRRPERDEISEEGKLWLKRNYF